MQNQWFDERMPLLDGIERLEKTIGNITLFEFMKDESMSQPSVDAEMHGRVNQMLLENLKDENFIRNLKAALEDADKDFRACRVVGNFVLGCITRPNWWRPSILIASSAAQARLS